MESPFGVDLSVLDLIPLPISAHDREGRFVYLNRTLHALPGVAEEGLLGRPLLLYVPEPVRSVVRTGIARCLDEQLPVEVEAVFTNQAGEGGLATRVGLLPLCRGGRAEGFLAFGFGTGGRERIERDAVVPVRLTRRQEEVLRLIEQGLSTAEIASALSLTPQTVRNHLQALFERLEVASRTEALASARRRGLLSPRPLLPGDVPVPARDHPSR